METEVVSVSITKIIKELGEDVSHIADDFYKLIQMGFSDSVEIVMRYGNDFPIFTFSEAQIAKCRAFIGVLVNEYYSDPYKLFEGCMYAQCGDNPNDYPKFYVYCGLCRIGDILTRIAYWAKDIAHAAHALSEGKSIKYYSREDCGIIRAELARIGRINPCVRFISYCYSRMRPSVDPIIREISKKISDEDIPPNPEAREIYSVFRKFSETIDYTMIEGSFADRPELFISPKIINIYIQNMGEILDVCLKHREYIEKSIRYSSPYRINEYAYGILAFITRYLYGEPRYPESYVTTERHIQKFKAIVCAYKSSANKLQEFEGVDLDLDPESVDKYIQKNYKTIDHFRA